MGESDTTLSVEQARTLPDGELRALFVEIAVDLLGSFGESTLPQTFPRRPATMTRDEMLTALEEHEYWFDPPEQRLPRSVA